MLSEERYSFFIYKIIAQNMINAQYIYQFQSFEAYYFTIERIDIVVLRP